MAIRAVRNLYSGPQFPAETIVKFPSPYFHSFAAFVSTTNSKHRDVIQGTSQSTSNPIIISSLKNHLLPGLSCLNITRLSSCFDCSSLEDVEEEVRARKVANVAKSSTESEESPGGGITKSRNRSGSKMVSRSIFIRRHSPPPPSSLFSMSLPPSLTPSFLRSLTRSRYLYFYYSGRFSCRLWLRKIYEFSRTRRARTSMCESGARAKQVNSKNG